MESYCLSVFLSDCISAYVVSITIVRMLSIGNLRENQFILDLSLLDEVMKNMVIYFHHGWIDYYKKKERVKEKGSTH